MHLIVNQVVQLQVVHVADRDRALELLAGTSVIQPRLRAGLGQTHALGNVYRVRELKHLADFGLGGTVKNRGRKRYTVLEVGCELDDLVVGKLIETGARSCLVVNLVQIDADLLDLDLLLVAQHFGHALSKALGGPAEVDLEHLPDVHP